MQDNTGVTMQGVIHNVMKFITPSFPHSLNILEGLITTLGIGVLLHHLCTPKHTGLKACDHESDYRVLARSQNEGALEHSNNKAVCRPLSNFRSNKNIKVLKTSRVVKNGQLHHAMLAHNKEHQADWLETVIRVWESQKVII